MRRTPIVILGMLCLLAAALWPGSGAVRSADETRVLCSILPVYAFTQAVVGDDPHVSVELLVPSQAGCPHDYSLRPRDVQAVLAADVIVTHGLGAETFLNDPAFAEKQTSMLSISDTCEAIFVGDHEQCDHEHDHEHEANIHAWVSPAQAVRQARLLKDKLPARLPMAGRERYRANADTLIQRLEALDREYRTASQQFANRTIVTFHEAFDYLARDYGLEVAATMSGAHSESPSDWGKRFRLRRESQPIR